MAISDKFQKENNELRIEIANLTKKSEELRQLDELIASKFFVLANTENRFYGSSEIVGMLVQQLEKSSEHI